MKHDHTAIVVVAQLAQALVDTLAGLGPQGACHQPAGVHHEADVYEVD
jgi:hypothetical protein